MRQLLPIALCLLVLSACGEKSSAVNPDPNHTHADFALWIRGEKIDFSAPEFMSGTSDESDPEHTKHHAYLHLHDGIGHVIHRHKPELTVREFFESIGVTFSKDGLNVCMNIPGHSVACEDEALHQNWVFVVNGERQPFFDPSFVFEDLDQLLILLPESDTEEGIEAEIQRLQQRMTDDSCLYSKTCPERGDPPTENCIADPAVPCVQ